MSAKSKTRSIYEKKIDFCHAPDTYRLVSICNSWGGYISTALGIEIPLAGYEISGDVTRGVSTVDYFDAGGRLDISAGYMFNDWAGLGFGTGLVYSGTDMVAFDDMFIIPFTADILIDPGTGNISFPLVLSVGGHVQFLDDTFGLGPAFGLSAGIMIRPTESFSIGWNARADLLMQFADDFETTTCQIFLAPLQVQMICSL